MNGTSDGQKKVPIQGDELYFLYSATKPIVCTAALQLYEKGLLDLEDNVKGSFRTCLCLKRNGENNGR